MKLFGSALKSLLGNGLKTWLNVFVLSISFVLIIILQGILKGWSNQAIDDTVKWQIADGQYWNEKYDPYDFFSLDSSLCEIPAHFIPDVEKQLLEPIMISQASVYNEGRLSGVLIKGIRPNQKLLELPTAILDTNIAEIPVIIGAFQAKQSKLRMNDVLPFNGVTKMEHSKQLRFG